MVYYYVGMDTNTIPPRDSVSWPPARASRGSATRSPRSRSPSPSSRAVAAPASWASSSPRRWRLGWPAPCSAGCGPTGWRPAGSWWPATSCGPLSTLATAAYFATGRTASRCSAGWRPSPVGRPRSSDRPSSRCGRCSCRRPASRGERDPQHPPELGLHPRSGGRRRLRRLGRCALGLRRQRRLLPRVGGHRRRDPRRGAARAPGGHARGAARGLARGDQPQLAAGGTAGRHGIPRRLWRRGGADRRDRGA